MKSMYLLDTFALICLMSAPDRMEAEVRTMLTSTSERVYYSPVNIWEIEIKSKSGKLERPAPDLIDATLQLRLTEFPILAKHAVIAGQLPLHHKDPFDRMLIAQAKALNLTVVTPDALFLEYGVKVLDC